MKTRTRTALLLACSTALFSGAATAQDNNASAEIEEILVVGSRAPGRSAENSPVPVDVLTAADLVQSGTIGGEIGSLLESNIPSFNMPRQSNSDQADMVRAAQLRGLNPDHVLVLVNGKRRHANAVISVESKLGKGSAAVDFNNIPTSSIERIEVLRDGAAAQYGSDAIAGVINIVLKNSSEGGNVSASYGAHVTSVDVIDDDITDGETAIISFNKGFSLGDGFLNVSGKSVTVQKPTAQDLINFPPSDLQNLSYQSHLPIRRKPRLTMRWPVNVTTEWVMVRAKTLT